jgi:hypothetical protein
MRWPIGRPSAYSTAHDLRQPAYTSLCRRLATPGVLPSDLQPQQQSSPATACLGHAPRLVPRSPYWHIVKHILVTKWGLACKDLISGTYLLFSFFFQYKKSPSKSESVFFFLAGSLILWIRTSEHEFAQVNALFHALWKSRYKIHHLTPRFIDGLFSKCKSRLLCHNPVAIRPAFP